MLTYHQTHSTAFTCEHFHKNAHELDLKHMFQDYILNITVKSLILDAQNLKCFTSRLTIVFA